MYYFDTEFISLLLKAYHHILLSHTVQYCITSHTLSLHRIVVYCIILYITVLYCTVHHLLITPSFPLFALRTYLQSQVNTERNQTPTTSSHIISYPVMSETSSTKSGPTRKYQNTGTGRSTSRGTGKVSRAVAELEARTRGHLEQATQQLQSTTLASATVDPHWIRMLSLHCIIAIPIHCYHYLQSHLSVVLHLSDQ